MKSKAITVPEIMQRKGKKKIVMLTAYDCLFSRILDECEIDIILVGDSVGPATLGLRSTLDVEQAMMIHHTSSVARGVQRSLIIGDMPFGSYHISVEETLRHAIEFIHAGAHGVKIEGAHYLDRIESLVRAGIPVMGHVGLTPQSIHVFGGYRVQGRGNRAQEQILQDALAIENAGAFALVIEGVPPSLAGRITQQISIPTIGIGAGAQCDGQVLVLTDLLGLDPHFKPKFVRTYANLHGIVHNAICEYKNDVISGAFPSDDYCYEE